MLSNKLHDCKAHGVPPKNRSDNTIVYDTSMTQRCNYICEH